jgi:LPS export ABC transporter permease LptF/LPS export ABC transporter permease LptG
MLHSHATLTFSLMRILDRYIAREVTRHAFLGLLIFTFVLFVPKLVRLMEIFVRHTGSAPQIITLFLCVVPSILVFTIPMGVLIGVLLGLGRMSMDSEIIALTALGISRKRILIPVGILATVGAGCTLVMTLWLAPLALRTGRSIETTLITSQISFAVQPRVFDERFPHMVLYVNDVSASGAHWTGVFLADTAGESGSQITLAESAIVVAEPSLGKLELHLNGGATHEYERATPDHYSITAFGRSDWPIEFTSIANAEERALSNPERTTHELLADHSPHWRDARVELQQRFAFPAACFVFALIAVPLGAQPRRGGRAAGSLLAIFIIAAYYLILVTGAGYARQGIVSPAVGTWAADFVLTIAGLVLFPRMERYRGESALPGFYSRFNAFWRLIRRRNPIVRARAAFSRSENGSSFSASFSGVPSIIDFYILRRFFYFFVVIMVAFLFLFEIFTFFELAEDIRRHNAPFIIVINYFRYLIPYSVYQFTPLGALVSVLVTLGILSKNNEIVAFKASGISLYRLSVPILLAGIGIAGALLILDDTYLPYANQRQDAYRAIIKGRPPQTHTALQRWILGENYKVYNYDVYDPNQKLFGGLSVLELDPSNFQMRRRVFATRARWLEDEKTWVLESGWLRDFSTGAVERYSPFKVTTLPELVEPPSYFNREVIQAFQMSWRDLRRYIGNLRSAGFDVSSLTVQWHKKIAYPLIAPISMMLAVPFALFVGSRGAIGGIAIGVGIGIAYWALAALTEAMGGIGQLPPFLAAWSPDLIFFFLALYFFFKMPT